MSTTPDSGESVGIEVTETAAEKAQSMLAEEGLEAEGAGLRLMAREKNCDCGDIAYGIEFAEEPEERDSVVEEHGLTIVVDQESREYVENLQLDYVNDFRGEGFTLQRTEAHDAHEHGEGHGHGGGHGHKHGSGHGHGSGGGCGCGGHHH